MTRSNARIVRILVPALLMGLVMVMAGCTPWATYPSSPGFVNISDPWIPPIPELMADSIRTVHERDGRGPGDAMVFNLPPNTPDRVYHRVIAHLSNAGSSNARPMRDVTESAYHIIEVRVRAVESEVDLIHVGAAGVPEEVTLSFQHDILHGQRLVRVRPWRYRVELPPPNYVPGGESGGELTETEDLKDGVAGVESGQ